MKTALKRSTIAAGCLVAKIMNKVKTISINEDLVIELHHNPHLQNKPYQLRVYGYYDYTEHRMNEYDLRHLIDILSGFVSEVSDANIKYD